MLKVSLLRETTTTPQHPSQPLKNSMHILWNNHRDIRNPASGGAERTIDELGRRLVHRGHRVTLLTSRWRTGPAREYVNGVDITRYRGSLLPHLLLPIIASKRPKPDVIVDDMAHALPWASPWLTNVPGVVFFRHCHARTLPGQVSPAVARLLTAIERLYPQIYKDWPFVTESSSSVEDLVSLGVPRGRCTRIPPGVDTTVFTPMTKTAIPTLVYFGGLRRYKRPEHALLVQQRLLGRGIHAKMIIVGEGPSSEDMKKLAHQLKLDDCVVFPGRVGDAALAEIVGRAWVNIHCSTHEGWGLSVVEAAAAGTPTSAYRVAGIAESVSDGVSGILVPDGDIDALADAVQSLLRSERRWVTSCREWASRFNWEGATNEWETVLRLAGAREH